MSEIAENIVVKPGWGFKEFKDLCRPFTMLAPAVGVYAGAIMAAGKIPVGMTIVAAIIGGLLNAASNALNQITDLDIDRMNKPERPIASGKMSVQTAGIIATILYLICFVVAYFAVGLGFFVVILIGAIFSWAYSIPPIRTKNHPLVANPTMAVPRGILLILAGYVAQLELTGTFSSASEHIALLWNSPTPWAAGFIMFLFLVGAASTKDFADIEGDKEHGARTIPVVLGVRKAAWFMAPFFVIPFLLVFVAVPLGYLIPATLPLAALSIYGAFISWIILRDPESLALEGNHPSWKHMYLLMMLSQIGFAVAYLVGSPAA